MSVGRSHYLLIEPGKILEVIAMTDALTCEESHINNSNNSTSTSRSCSLLAKARGVVDIPGKAPTTLRSPIWSYSQNSPFISNSMRFTVYLQLSNLKSCWDSHFFQKSNNRARSAWWLKKVVGSATILYRLMLWKECYQDWLSCLFLVC